MFGGLFEVTDLIMHSPQTIDQNNILEREKYQRNYICCKKENDSIPAKSVKSLKVQNSRNLNKS